MKLLPLASLVLVLILAGAADLFPDSGLSTDVLEFDTQFAALTPPAAGQDAAREDVPSEHVGVPCEDFCEWWKGLGTLYLNAENPYVQEFKFIGRLHYQYGVVNGEGSGNEVD